MATLIHARKVEGSRIRADRMVSGATRFADDGVRCPGHPDWKPWEPRRLLGRDRCSVDLGYVVMGDRIHDVRIACNAG